MHVKTAFDGGVGKDLFGGIECKLGYGILMIVEYTFFEADFRILVLRNGDVGSHNECE